MRYHSVRSFAAAAIVLAATPVLARETDYLPSGDPAKKASEAIVVTGSRIPLSGNSGLEPTVSIDDVYLRARNLTNIADALNQIPGFRNSDTPDGVQERHG